MFRFGGVDRTIFYLNIVSFLHMFYIEKCQEFAYFDIFLGIVQKKWRMQNSGFIWCKKELSERKYETDIIQWRERRSLPFLPRYQILCVSDTPFRRKSHQPTFSSWHQPDSGTFLAAPTASTSVHRNGGRTNTSILPASRGGRHQPTNTKCFTARWRMWCS